MAALRIVFMGTAELSCDSLRGLLAAPGFQVAAVVTQPDRPKGRDLRLQPSPVKELGLQAGLPVLQPERARSEAFLAELRGLQPELIAVVAYGQILPPDILSLPRFGCLNVHTSLLPRYRGAAPIQWAILNGETETGVTIMKMDAGLDTGGILTQARTPIQPEDTAETLRERLARMGAELLARTIPDYIAGGLVPREQPAAGVSYAPKIRKQDGRIDWRQPARAIWNRVRGLVPWPGAFSFLPGQPQPHLLKIWQAEVVEDSGAPGVVLRADRNGIVVGCGEAALRIRVLQREGGRRLAAADFLAGQRLSPGQALG
ncbi:MAG TPA: methionyl-tRNA formyltransferase [Verrucomicrobiota bacterium]|nr:methionyl-tRNA formyltransferase [Verrucomicrobiota bacterium]